MKKQILNIGTELNRAEQKEVFGGTLRPSNFGPNSPVICQPQSFKLCESDEECCGGVCQAATIYVDHNGNYNVSGLGTSLGTQNRCI